MPHGVVLPAPEPLPLSPADRASMCSFAAALPQSRLEFAGAGAGRVLAMLTVAERHLLFERSSRGIRVRDIRERHSLAEAGTIELVLAMLRDRLGPRPEGEVVPFGSEAGDRAGLPEAAGLPPAAPAEQGGPVVLLVEDQSYSALELEELLSRAGYRPLVAANGAAALAAAASLPHPARAAVVNLQLRGAMGGREVVLRLRQECPGLPVVALTGHPPSAPEADLRGLGGPTARLVRPIEADRLLQCLADVAARGRGG